VAPIAWIGAAWLLGTVAAHQLPDLPAARWCVPLLLGALIALRFAAARPVLVAALAAAWTCWCAGERLAERLPAAAIGNDFMLTGTVGGFASASPGQVTFPFAVAKPRPPGVPPLVRLTWYDPPTEVQPGEALTVTARLRPPRGARNPGGFDYEQWLFVNAYGATGYVRSGGRADGNAPSFATRWLKFRAELAQRIGASSTDADGVALLTALALGERFRFTEQHWADFRRTGTSHLVAVSGMHVALLGLVVFMALRRLCLMLPEPLPSYDLEIAAGASLLATGYYAALTGFAIPAQRSLVMIGLALGVLVLRWRLGATQIVAATLLVVLVWDPFAPLAASFWLSFVAVVILIVLGSPRLPLRRRAGALRRAANGAWEFARLQWWIGLALLPLTAWYFGEVSAIGPLVNLVAIPLFNLCLVPLTVLMTAALSFDVLAEWCVPLAAAAAWLAGETVRGLRTLGELPLAAVPMPLPPWPAIAVALLGVGFAVYGSALPGRRLAWLALLPLWMPAVRLPPQGAAEVVVLDVGHGLAVLVATRTHRLLFDAGPKARSGFDSGEEIVVPALAATGRRGLQRLIVSHADNDHAGGAGAVVAAFPDADVVMGPDVRAQGRVCARGQRWDWDGVRFSVLHPSSDFGWRGNESSCVLKIEAGPHSLLVTGDIERRGESAVLAQPLSARVVVVPHHGSATSSSPAFVTAVSADYAIVSAGFANRWGFPRPEIRQRWEQSGARVVVTGDSGAVTVALGPERIAVETERERRHRYWHAPTFAW
jgi:competence protein ComEC